MSCSDGTSALDSARQFTAAGFYPGAIFTNYGDGPTRPPEGRAEVVNILSLDGGGMKGLFSASIVREMVRYTGQEPHQMFDIFAGTSIGGILATHFADGNAVDDTIAILDDDGPYIFSTDPDVPSRRVRLHTKVLKTLSGGIGYSFYPNDKLQSVLRREFGDGRALADVPKPVVVTAYNTTTETPTFFSNMGNPSHTAVTAVDALMSTSAAPYYLPAWYIDYGSNGGQQRMVDGAVFLNNPTRLVLSSAIENGVVRNKTVNIISIGTGGGKISVDIDANEPNDESSEDYQNVLSLTTLYFNPLAAAGNILTLFERAAGGSQETTHLNFAQEDKQSIGVNYLRINGDLAELGVDDPEMDITTQEQRDNLRNAGVSLYQSMRAEIEPFLDRAFASHPPADPEP